MTETKKRKGYRLLHLPNGVWQYRVGRSEVVIRSPQGKRRNVPCQELSGVDDWERACHKRYGHITPSMVREYIEHHWFRF